jgi:soluble lytic murein transglycosylase-like protein
MAGIFPRGAFGAALLACAIAPAPALLASEDFTFRRIAVAPPESGPRITVQIDPQEQARRLALPVAPAPSLPRAAVPAAPVANARFDWFWLTVPTARDAVQGRFQLALSALSEPPQGQPVPEPRVQHLQTIAERHGRDILVATVGTSVSPALALAVISVESAGRVDAVSRAGAQGLMQLIPATAERFAVADAFDPRQNIRGGVTYLDWLLGEFDRDVVLALAGYNAGEGAVRRNNGVPPFAETRDYVPRVLAAWRVARGLCTVPPELPSDPCIFRIGQEPRAAAPAQGL